MKRPIGILSNRTRISLTNPHLLDRRSDLSGISLRISTIVWPQFVSLELDQDKNVLAASGYCTDVLHVSEVSHHVKGLTNPSTLLFSRHCKISCILTMSSTIHQMESGAQRTQMAHGQAWLENSNTDLIVAPLSQTQERANRIHYITTSSSATAGHSSSTTQMR